MSQVKTQNIEEQANCNDSSCLIESYDNVRIYMPDEGDSIVGAFCGNPFEWNVHWVEEHYENCAPSFCKYCQLGLPSVTRIMLNFYTVPENAMKVIDGNGKWFRSIFKFFELYGIDDWLYEIKRHKGMGKSPTSYEITKKEEIDDRLKAKIKKTPLNLLDEVAEACSGNGMDF